MLGSLAGPGFGWCRGRRQPLPASDFSLDALLGGGWVLEDCKAPLSTFSCVLVPGSLLL